MELDKLKIKRSAIENKVSRLEALKDKKYQWQVTEITGNQLDQ